MKTFLAIVVVAFAWLLYSVVVVELFGALSAALWLP